MHVKLELKVNSSLYVKDPLETRLGKEIIKNSIILINDLGIENFTLKKLAISINSSEQTVYRYFENKYQLLKYLTSWYWSWLEYQIFFHTHNITDPRKKIVTLIKVISDSVKNDPSFEHVDEEKLAYIAVKYRPISYINQETDLSEKNAAFESFISLSNKVTEVITNFSPNCKNPKAIALTLLRTTQDQVFFSRYFSNLSDLQPEENNEQICKFVEKMLFSFLN